MPLVSIVIPVYNVLPYLKDCLDSVKQQTFQDWECIIVDDGSTDGCDSFIDNYILEDKRFSVIHKANGGLAAARQTGFQKTTGKYVVHVDSDDYIGPKHISCLVECAEKTQADIVLEDYYIDHDGNLKLIHQEPSVLNERTIVCEVLNSKHHAGLWCKIFRRDLLMINNIPPAPYSYYEDMFTFLSCLHFAHKVVYLPIATYHYRFNQQSLTNDTNINKRIDMYKQCMENLSALVKTYDYEMDQQVIHNLYIRVNYEKGVLSKFIFKSRKVRSLLTKYFPESYTIIPKDSFRNRATRALLLGYTFPYLFFKIIHFIGVRLKAIL